MILIKNEIRENSRGREGPVDNLRCQSDNATRT
jgi:hypothetical protein